MSTWIASNLGLLGACFIVIGAAFIAYLGLRR